jgi:hypothetical protein
MKSNSDWYHYIIEYDASACGIRYYPSGPYYPKNHAIRMIGAIFGGHMHYSPVVF